MFVDEFGGIPVDEPATDEYGGVSVVDEPTSTPGQRPFPVDWSLEANPASFEPTMPGNTPMFQSFVPLPDPFKGKTTLGKLVAAPANFAIQTAGSVASPGGLLTLPLGGLGKTGQVAAGLGFGVPGVVGGLKRVYEGGAMGDLQEAIEGGLQTLTGGLITAGGVKGLDTAKMRPPEGFVEPVSPAVPVAEPKPVIDTRAPEPTPVEPTATPIVKPGAAKSEVTPSEPTAKPSGFNPPAEPAAFGSTDEALAYRESYKNAELEFYKSLGLDEKDSQRMLRASDARSTLDTSKIESKLTPEAKAKLDAFSTGEGSEMYDYDRMFDPSSISGIEDKPTLAQGVVSALTKDQELPNRIGDRMIYAVSAVRKLKELGGSWSDIARALDEYTTRISGSQGDKLEVFKSYGEKIKAFLKSQGVELPQGELGVTPEVTQATKRRPSTLKQLTERMESGEALTSAEQKRYRQLRDQATGAATEPDKPEVSVGPGAASPGDVPQSSQLHQLSRAIQSQISPVEPLTDRMKAALNVADAWAKGKDSVTQGIGRIRAVSQALIDGYLHLPKWTTFDDAIGKWTGADQKTAVEVYDFQKRIKKAIPNRFRQEAITNWIQADGDETVLRARATASKPALRKGYDLALTLNEGEKTLAGNIRSYLDARLDEGIKAGLLRQGVDNYVTQVWKKSNEATQKLWADLFGAGTLNPAFKFARQRIFDSYFEGEQKGYTPQNKTIGNLISTYDLAFNRALSARALIKRLQTGTASDGKPIAMTSGKTVPVTNAQDIPEAFLIKPNLAPEGAVSVDGRPYRPIDHWALRDWKWATKGPNGENVFVQGDMLIHPDHFKHLDNVLKTSRLRANPITGTLLQVGAFAKQTKLSLSPFHTVQEGVHALAHRVNPFSPAEIDLDIPAQKGLVEHGLMVMDPHGAELFAEGASGGGLVGKIPGLGKLQTLYTDMTFKDYIPRLKMAMALDALERNRKAYSRSASDDQIQALTARESNAAFGEQNYKMMGRSPNVQDVLRLTLLAPDFLESRFRFAAQAMKPYGREQRIALGLMFGFLYTGGRILNKTLDDDYHWNKPFSVFRDGREYRLRTVLGDAQHLLTDPRSFWYNRISPISRMITEGLTSRDDRGIKRNAAEQFVDFLSWFKPIPLQTRSDQTIGQAVLASAGIPSKAFGKQQEIYQLSDQWMKSSQDPKVQERYQRLRQETLPDSPYRPLRDALKRDDLAAARKEYEKLKQSRNPTEIAQAMRLNRPFTGSLASEARFKASLSPEQMKIYNAAIQERQNQYQKFLKAIR